MNSIKFSDDAINDLISIKEYITVDLKNENSANKIVSEIMKQIKLLSEFPNSGSSLSSIINIKTDYRYILSGNYTVFYRFENNLIYIVRVLYSRCDFLNILFDNKP